MRRDFHPLAWITWLAAAATSSLLTRNPFYLLLLLMAAGTIFPVLDGSSPTLRAWRAFIRIGVLLLLFSILANGLTVHYGDLTLFSLPKAWPVLGGRITLEATLYGLGTGLSLLSLLVVFAIFNSAVPPSALLRMVPGFLYQAGVVVAIAITFVPQMINSAQTIREAQRVRGHRFRGLRDALPLLVPLLAGGLERSIQLAESMEARGFGGIQRPGTARRVLAARVLVLFGLLGLAFGSFVRAYFPAPQTTAEAALVLSLGALLSAFWMLSHTVERSRYNRWLWRPRDTILTVASSLVLLTILGVWAAARGMLVYYPYPPATPWPQFHPLVGTVLMLLALPALLISNVKRPKQQVHRKPVSTPVQGSAEASR